MPPAATAPMATPADEDGQVRDNPQRQRFELALGQQGVAFINYRERPGAASAGAARGARVLLLTHAEVPAALRGTGIGARLTRGVLELMRARGERAVPYCPYIVAFIRRHPDYGDVLA